MADGLAKVLKKEFADETAEMVLDINSKMVVCKLLQSNKRKLKELWYNNMKT